MLASLSHPKLPAYVDHFEEDGVLYLVMERRSKGRRCRCSARAARWASATSSDFYATRTTCSRIPLHGRSPAVIHRDIKPSNILQRPDGTFAFVDFGAVRDRMRPEGGSTVVGTFGYMAPEQFQGRAGPGSDVYAMGATALSMLTGEEPENLPHRGLGIDVAAALRGRSSRKLESALTRMLQVDPDARATRILPLLAGSDTRHDKHQLRNVDDIGARIREQVERDVKRRIDRATRQARRFEEKARRRAERTAESAGLVRPRRAWRAPWFIIVAFTLALVVAQIAVTIALRVAVPMVLVMLSIVFGAGLRRAARNVSGAGREAGDAIRRAREVVGGDGGRDDGIRVDADDERVRVRDEEEKRARVADVADDDGDELDDDEHHDRRRGA